ncbi:hypothetical protein T265_03855 [Opisthorchis viverrini]|uniref:Uncharacterized protein n=1 Tax=Opisthorchis viverrini TaxID=6198 RepID=A0A074ZQ61_OPIVI|nr:hypothetical protein T265_03855 [Opisthorchis viverrini]KER29558.1 hypothetical protein T265_03855 [Opisthorchis viverrini]
MRIIGDVGSEIDQNPNSRALGQRLELSLAVRVLHLIPKVRIRFRWNSSKMMTLGGIDQQTPVHFGV